MKRSHVSRKLSTSNEPHQYKTLSSKTSYNYSVESTKKRTKLGLALTIPIGLLCLYILLVLSYQPAAFTHILQSNWSWPLARISAPVSTGQAHLHVLIPASKQDVNLCKLFLSLAVLGYPTPVLINWNRKYDDSNLVEGGSHLAKITGIQEYVDSLSGKHDNDLVLMIDGYDVWMQLRPQTLLDRYFDINKRANSRIKAEIGPAAAAKHGIRQEIVFGCQKRCWPWTFNDPPCYAVPNSTLPDDIFGPRTDTPSEDEEAPYINNRPRFLVSGTAIGTVRAFRKLFRQAVKQLESEANFGSDQYIFSHIFGDQEIWREAMRRDELSTESQMHGHFSQQHIEEVRAKASKVPDGKWEFGIGIDYRSEIVLNTVFAEDDTAWVAPNAEQDLARLQEQHDVPSKYRSTNLSPDISSTLPPYWTFSEENLPRWTDWHSVPLFTNVFTGIHPVVIHHNAHRDKLKSRRETWWPLIWFQSHVRVLFDAYIYAPVTSVGYAGYETGAMREYWPYEIWKGGARSGVAAIGVSSEDWVRFDETLGCSDYHEELFRDGKGPWVLPDAH